VGEALLVGRRAAMLDAHTNRPAGRRYNEIFGTWLKSHGFGCLDKSDRGKLMVCMDRRTEVDTWRLSLPSNQRLQINHPASVLRHLKASTQIPTTNKKMSPIENCRLHMRKSSKRRRNNSQKNQNRTLRSCYAILAPTNCLPRLKQLDGMQKG
jgi:hypothetical protein